MTTVFPLLCKFITENLTAFECSSICDCVSIAFHDSPPDRSFSLPPSRCFDKSINDAAKEGISIALFDEKENNCVGVVINTDFVHVKDHSLGSDRTVDFEIENDMYDMADELKVRIYERYFEKNGLEKGQVLYLSVLAVPRIYAGRGFGKKLVEKTIEMAREKGFRSIVVLATNVKTMRIVTKYFSFVQLPEELKYSSWKNAKGEISLKRIEEKFPQESLTAALLHL